MTETMPPARSNSALFAHPSAELYGSDRVMLETVSALTGAGWAVTVITPFAGPLHEEVRLRGGSTLIVGIPVLRKSSLRPAGLLKLVTHSVLGAVRIAGLIRRHRPGIVYVSTLTQPVWLITARLFGARVVCHVHEAEQGVAKVIRKGLAFPLFFAHRIVFNSRFSQQVVMSEFGSLAGRSAVVYNGVPGPAARTPPRLSVSDGLGIVYVGRLSPRKGPDLILDALSALRERGIATRLQLVGAVFAGYEWYEQQLHERVAELGLTDGVSFTGFEPSVWESLAAGDVVVVPSRIEEPFGNTAVEAVLASRPVVVSNAGGLPEAVAGFGSALAVSPDSATALADALARISQEWDQFRLFAQADATAAEAKFGPAIYRAAMLSELRAARDGGAPARRLPRELGATLGRLARRPSSGA